MVFPEVPNNARIARLKPFDGFDAFESSVPFRVGKTARAGIAGDAATTVGVSGGGSNTIGSRGGAGRSGGTNSFFGRPTTTSLGSRIGSGL